MPRGRVHASGNRPESLQPTEAHVPREASRRRSGAGSQAAPAFRPTTRNRVLRDRATLEKWDGTRAVVITRKARYLKGERVGTHSWDVGRALCGRPHISGGDDQRGRTRVAGATGALAAGAPR